MHQTLPQLTLKHLGEHNPPPPPALNDDADDPPNVITCFYWHFLKMSFKPVINFFKLCCKLTDKQTLVKT